MPQKPKKRPVNHSQQAAVTLQNAKTQMTNFIKYYKGINIVPEEEWDTFFTSLFTDLPFSFRIGETCRKFPNGRGSTVGQAKVLLNFMKEVMMPKLTQVTIEDKQFDMQPLSWYPGEMAWQCNIDMKIISVTPGLNNFVDFMMTEEKAQYVFKQEVTWMIPALLCDINPSQKILEMCCAPGYQTCQLAEMMYVNSKKQPSGILISNDNDWQRIHFRWSQGSNTFYTSEDVKNYPDIYTTEEHTPESKLLFDRIFIDAPTSNDGTFRKNSDIRNDWTMKTNKKRYGGYEGSKNVDIRRDWAVTKGQKKHKELRNMLRRGVEMLQVGGELIYSTASMNPIENEAVVAAIIHDAEGSLEIVKDKSKRLPGFKTRPGMSSWQVMSPGLVFYDTYESCPEWFRNENEATMFPPADDAETIGQLERCLRILPHDNDTSAAFFAVIRRVGDIPWMNVKEEPEVKEEPMETEEKPAGAEGGQVEVKKEPVDQKGDAKKKVPYSMPVRCDVNIGVCEIEWQTETTNDKLDTDTDVEITKYDPVPMRISKSCIPTWYMKKLEESAAHFEEITPEDKPWEQIKTMYDIKKFDPASSMVKYVQEGRDSVYLFMSPNVRNLVKCNPAIAKKMKNFSGGLGIFRGGEIYGQPSVSPQGHLALLPYMGKRVLSVTRPDLVVLVKENIVMLTELSDKLQTEINAIEDNGPVYFIYEPKGKNADPKCPITLRFDKYKTYVKDSTSMKGDNCHNLRMCNIDPAEAEEEDEDDDDEETEEPMA